MQLHEKVRPKRWEDVTGQDKAVRTIQGLVKRGIGGRAVWISGQSGTGKTTIGKLIAAELADDVNVEELDASECTPARLREIERQSACRAIGVKTGRAYLVNEAHGLREGFHPPATGHAGTRPGARRLGVHDHVRRAGPAV